MIRQPPSLCLLEGRTNHMRCEPFQRRFSYPIFMIDIDIDRLDDASRHSRLFCVDRAGLFSLRRRDHGARKDGPLRPWAEQMLGKAGVDCAGASIRLITFPRHLGYRFAPLSIWLARDPRGAAIGVIHEVNNTFGESHAYVAALDGRCSEHSAEKRFHVSPFFDVSGRYRFRLRDNDDQFALVIDTLQGNARTHMATILAHRMPASTDRFVRAAIRRPASSFGVSFAIHWEALKLWMRGAKYHSRPAVPARAFTIAEASADISDALSRGSTDVR